MFFNCSCFVQLAASETNKSNDDDKDKTTHSENLEEHDNLAENSAQSDSSDLKSSEQGHEQNTASGPADDSKGCDSADE